MRLSLLAGAAALLLASAPARAQQVPPRTRPDTTRPAPTPAPARPPAPDTTRRAPADTTRRAPVTAPTDTTAAVTDTTGARRDSARIRRVGAGTAFYRSLLIPGWGQISGHAYTRAGVFITLQGASWFMLVKTLNKLKKSQEEVDSQSPRLQKSIIDSLTAIKDTSQVRFYQQNPAALKVLGDSFSPGHNLLKSRKKQREDWITLTAFWTLVSGVDAFINAQLQDFPAGVNVEPRNGGGTQISVTVPARTLLHPGDLLHRRKPLPARSFW